jgi:hypothetical protein
MDSRRADHDVERDEVSGHMLPHPYTSAELATRRALELHADAERHRRAAEAGRAARSGRRPMGGWSRLAAALRRSPDAAPRPDHV